MKSFLTFIFILLLAGVAVYYYLQNEHVRNQLPQTENTEPLQLPVDPTPEIAHPITESPVIIGDSGEEKPVEKETEEPLPALEDSDDRVKQILSGIIGSDVVEKFFRGTGLIHRFVVTVDSLPKNALPIKIRLLPPVSGKFLVHEVSRENITIDPENFKRYDTYIQLFGKLDTEQFVKWYTRFYTLIQEDYDSLGYKNLYFNDRFVFVIDHLLETPEEISNIQLVQPKVFYNFADPSLQNLSSGQKILIRVGPANMAIIKAKLAEIRKRITATQ